MVRASIAMRLAASALAPSGKRTTRKLNHTTQHALSFFGSACVLGGLLTSVLLCTPNQGHIGPAVAQPALSACIGLPAGRPCERSGEHSKPALFAAHSSVATRRAQL